MWCKDLRRLTLDKGKEKEGIKEIDRVLVDYNGRRRKKVRKITMLQKKKHIAVGGKKEENENKSSFL